MTIPELLIFKPPVFPTENNVPGEVVPTPTFPEGVIRKLVAVEEPTTNWFVSPLMGLTASFAQGVVVPTPTLLKYEKLET